MVVGPGGRSLTVAHAGSISPFVGRQRELALLKEGFNEAESGRPHLVLIGDEAGMGKTPLPRERRATTDPRAMLICGHRYEDASIPHLLFVEVVRSLLDRRPQSLSWLARADSV